MAKITLGENLGLSRTALRRRQFLVNAIGGQERRVLEVGALNDPVFLKAEGEVWFADYFTREESAERHKDDPRHPPEKIVGVDYVLRDRTLPEVVTVPSSLAIANHVVEHLPNPIRWLQEVRAVSEPDGLLYLCVPDRRYTFDYFKPCSDAVDWLEAYHTNSEQPTRHQILRHIYYHADLRAPGAWAGKIPADHLHQYSMTGAIEVSAELAQVYTNVHCWVFVYQTFLTILSDLADTGLIPWTVERSEDAQPGTNEFQVLLRAL